MSKLGQIRELHSAGIAFGSHTHTHPQLLNIPRAVVTQELRRSKNIIEDKLGSAVTDFSYPYYFPEENSIFKAFISDELMNAGYLRSVTTIIGRHNAGESEIFMRRLPVNSEDDNEFFDAKLNGSYDWLRRSQYIVKKVRSVIR